MMMQQPVKKNKCVFCCKASIAPPFAICPFKEYNCSMEIMFCFEQSAMLLDFQKVFKKSHIAANVAKSVSIKESLPLKMHICLCIYIYVCMYM